VYNDDTSVLGYSRGRHHNSKLPHNPERHS